MLLATIIIIAFFYFVQQINHKPKKKVVTEDPKPKVLMEDPKQKVVMEDPKRRSMQGNVKQPKALIIDDEAIDSGSLDWN